MLIIIPIVILFLLATFAPDFTARHVVTLAAIATPFVLAGGILAICNMVNGVHDGILNRLTKTKWVFVKETDEYIMFMNSSDPTHAKFVNKEAYLEERNSDIKAREKLYRVSK